MTNDLSFAVSALDKASKTFLDMAAAVDKFNAKLDELGAKEVKPEVDVEAAKAQADLDALDAYLDYIGKKKETAKVDVNTDDAGKALDSFTNRFALLGGAVAAGAPLVGAAVLGGIGAAFVGVGVAAEASNAKVQAGWQQLESTAKTTLVNGFSQFVPVLQGLESQAANTMSSLSYDFGQAAKATAPLLQAVGSDLITAGGNAVRDLSGDLQSLSPVAKAIGQDFLDVEAGAQGFIHNLDVSGSAQSLALLGQAAKEDLPAIGNLVSAITPLTNTVLAVLVPAIRDAANDLSLLRPILTAVETVVTPLAPTIAAVAPPLAAVALASKVLGSGWTDLGGAARALVSPFTDMGGTLESLANRFGVTTASQNAATKASLEQAAAQAAMVAAAKEEAAAQALVTFQADGSIASLQALTIAQDEQVTSASAAIAADKALAGAEEGVTVSMGPLGLILAVAGTALAGFAFSGHTATAAAQDLDSQIKQLASDAPAAAGAFAASNPAVSKFASELSAVGSSSQQFAASYSGSVAEAAQATQAFVTQQTNLGNSMLTASQVGNQAAVTVGMVGRNGQSTAMSVKDLADAVNGSKQAYDELTPAARSAVDQYNALNDIVPQAQRSQADVEVATQAETQALAAQGVALSANQNSWNQFASTVAANVTAFNNATAGLKGLFDNANASDQAANQAAAAQLALHQAVDQASASYNSAAQGVSQAEHSLAQSAQSVVNARYSEQQATQGVASAEQALANAQQQATNAENALIAARAAEAQQLKDLQRQVTDQGDAVASASVQLLDAQNAVKLAGLQGQTLNSIGPVTTENEAKYKLLLALSQAQHQYNDAVAQSQQLQQQNTAAQQAGINGSQSVISAQQSLVQAQQGVASAVQGVANAQHQQQQAALAVQEAQYEAQQASVAVASAVAAERTARLALTTAQQSNTNTILGNSQSAVANRDSIEAMYEANVKLYGPTQQAANITEYQGQQAGYTKDQVDQIITSLGGLNGNVTAFSIVGTPSLNMQALAQQLTAMGINPTQLGFTADQAQATFGTPGQQGAGTGRVFARASGGWLAGPGGPRDDLIPVMASNGEFIVNAASARRNGPLLEAINAQGFADGGWTGSAKTALGANVFLSMIDGFGQAMIDGLTAFGVKPASALPPNGPVDLGSFGNAGGGTAASGGSVPSGNYASVQAAVQAVANTFGWGSGAEWAAIGALMMQESGWNPTAQNPTSTAYGLFQFLNSTWAGYGVPKTSDPALQALAGFRYIKARYGDPIGAEQFHLAHNWYRDGGYVKPRMFADGGIVTRPTLGVLGEAGTEAVIPLNKARGAGFGNTYQLTVHNANNSPIDLQAQFRRMEIMAGL